MRFAVFLGAAVLLGVVVFAGLSPLFRPTTASRPIVLPSIMSLENDTSGDVTIQPRCAGLMRRILGCDFRDLPGYGNVPPGSVRPLIPQPPPGTATWYRVTDGAHHVLGCVSVPFGGLSSPSPAADHSNVNVSQLASCPDWADVP
jgi:hypothetical protein